MEIDYENDEGVQLFCDILVEEEFIKTGVENKSEEEIDRLQIKTDNILSIAAGHDFRKMVYMTDNLIEKDNPNPERQKTAFASTITNEVEKISIMKNYFATGDLKPLQEFWNNLYAE